MAFAVWQATITDQQGNIQSGAEIEVINEATGLPVQLYSTRTGTNKPNPFFATAEGFAQFYVAAGLYRITATNTGTGTTQTWRNVRLVEVATNAQAIAGTAGVLPDAAGVKAHVDSRVATGAEAIAGEAGVLPDANQVRRNHVAQIATIADLRLLEPAFDGQQVELLGHTVAGVGGGMFYHDAASTALDDNGVTILTTGSKRWVRKFGDFVTPVMFGAVGDGVTDDTAAIQAAIDTVYATGNYGIVEIPPSSGEYIFTTITVKSKITLKGAGGRLKLKDNTCTNAGTNYYIIHNLGHDRVTYDGLFVEGNRSGGNDLFTVADIITAVGFRTVVKNCVLYSAPDSAIMFSDCIRGACIDNYIEVANDVGIYVNGAAGSSAQQSIVKGNRIKSCGVTGIALKRELNNILVSDNVITDCPNAISCEDFGVGNGGHPYEVNICNNKIHNCGSVAIALNRLTNSAVTGNVLNNCNSNGIIIQGGVNSVISNNVITGGGSETSSAAALFAIDRVDPIDSSITTCTNLVICNNNVSNYLGKGFYAQKGNNLTITNNSLKVSAEGLRLDASVFNVIIQGNIIDGGLADLALSIDSTYILKNNIINNALAVGYRVISGGQPYPTSGTSTFTALYAGEEVLHLAGNVWFKAHGTEPQEWKQITS